MIEPLSKVVPYMLRYRWRYLVGALCVVASVFGKMLVPQMLGGSVDALRGVGDGAESSEIASLVSLSALGIVVVAVVGGLFRTASRLMILGNSRRAVHDLRCDVFDHLQHLSPSFYVRHQTGHIMSRCVNDMQNVQGLLGPVFMYLVELGVLYLIFVPAMMRVDVWLTAACLLPFPFFLYMARRLAGRIQRGTRACQEKLSEVSAKVDESLSGQKVIKSLALEGYDQSRFEGLSGEYAESMIQVARARATLQPLMGFLAALSVFLLLAVGGPKVVAGEVSIGQLVSMVFYLGVLAGPTGTLGFVISSLQRGAAAMRRIAEIQSMPITITEPAKPVADPVPRGGVVVRDLSVSFAGLADQPHLTGSLPDQAEDMQKARLVLDSVSFTVDPGQTLGIVGLTGSGKTTLLRALSRQVEIEPGQVFLDGVDATDIALGDVRKVIGVVPQETFLFSMTLADNVALGRPDASREEVLQAVATAQLDRDLDQLPLGLDTMLGERGVNLSGGQRQRTALARVVMLSPKILLLDDTLSAVDTHTADQILSSIEPMMRDRTTVIVAHRVSTVQHADRILVLDEGRVVERGTHSELVRANGLYAGLHQRQLRQEDSA